MLNVRIIACLDVRDGRVVKGKQFANLVDVDDPLALALYYQKQGADELLFYDITATSERRTIAADFVKNLRTQLHIPFGIGGGVVTLNDFGRLLNLGATKVSVNSGALKNPSLITAAAGEYGSETVLLALDVKRAGKSRWNVWANGGRVDTGLDALEWAQRGEDLGAGELILNSMDGDGIKQGYDLDLLKAIISKVNIPVIASGGAGELEHFAQGLRAGAEGLLAASVFHYGEIAIEQLKRYLQENGVQGHETQV